MSVFLALKKEAIHKDGLLVKFIGVLKVIECEALRRRL
jgi:hypothetical protein